MSLVGMMGVVTEMIIDLDILSYTQLRIANLCAVNASLS
jgi:hypothetical protein